MGKESLIYKISNRDTSVYKDYNLNTEITKDEAIKMYRVLTGACEQGTRDFVENNKIPKKLTIKEIIEITKGQYGNEKFKKFFESEDDFKELLDDIHYSKKYQDKNNEEFRITL